MNAVSLDKPKSNRVYSVGENILKSLFVYRLGGLQSIAELMQLDQELYGMHNEPINMALRRYAGMALTNLTYGDVVNKVHFQIIAYNYERHILLLLYN